MGKKRIKIKGKNSTPRCRICGRKLNPVDALISGVCLQCAKRQHEKIAGKGGD